MLVAVFSIIVIVHALIHLMGFAKAFELAELNQLTLDISKFSGVLWLLAAILFFVAIALLLMNVQAWWIPGVLAVLLSQTLVMMSWRDARFGTLPNVIILAPIIIALVSSLPSSFANTYRAEVQKRLTALSGVSIVSEEDMQHLPGPVQKYLHYVGAVGKPRVQNFRAVFSGGMKRTM